MKYHGAFAGLGLMPGFAGSPRAAGKSMAATSTQATSASATATSRTSRCGRNSTCSVCAAAEPDGGSGRTTPPALRTRQKCSAISPTSATGTSVVCSA